MSSYDLQQTGCSCSNASQRGFTMVELIVVIVLISILAAIALPRFQNSSAYQSYSLRSTILSSLKLAQKTALAQHNSAVYWVLSRPSASQWQIQLLLDTDTTDAVAPVNISPAQISDAFESDGSVGYEVSLLAGGNLSNLTLGNGQNLVVLYNQLGDMIEVAANINLAQANAYPNPNNSADRVNSSLQFSDSRGDFCLSLTGYSYAESCR